MRENILWCIGGVALTACIACCVAFWHSKDVDVSKVDVAIRDGIASADAELAAVIEHRPEVVTRVEVIRREATMRILSLGPDELVAAALSRAEAFRRRVAASSDIASPPGLAGGP